MKILRFLFVIMTCCFYSLKGMSAVNNSVEVHEAIETLHKHITALQAFNAKNKSLKIIQLKASKEDTFIDTVIEFGHELMRICVKKMLHEESLDPLFTVWQLFIAEYRDIDPHIFVKEMSILIFSIYKNILLTLHGNQQQEHPESLDDATIQEIVKLYNQVTLLPIRQILMGLDKCYAQFVRIMAAYGYTNTNMTWYEWIQKYWWVPPVVVTSAIVTAVQYFIIGSPTGPILPAK